MPQSRARPKDGKDREESEQRSKGKTPEQWASLWKKEFEGADKELSSWHRQARDVEKIYVDDRKDSEFASEKRTNMFTSDTVDLECLLYGRTPQTDVVRKHQDAQDEVGRVSALTMQRILNGDISRPNDRFSRFAGYALSDHLRTNFGLVRWRYEYEMRKVEAKPAVMRPNPETGQMAEAVPATPAHEEVAWEDVVAEYCHWRDVKWSPCRVWEEARWVSFRVPMTRDQLAERFGREGRRVSLNSKKYKDGDGAQEDQPRFPWDRADVWETWSKEHGKVFWVVEGHDRVLEVSDDPLELEDFWPCPRPLVDWITTTRFVPKPGYLIAQDCYRAVEKLTTRIDLLVDSLRVLGIYDENFEELQSLLETTDENRMVPVANWVSAVTEKGGLDGVISWFPLEQVVNTLEQLMVQRDKEKELLEQITGRADVQRGQLTNAGETATATRAKTKFASKRVQRKQDMFAEFVSDAQRIRAEIIAKMFSDETIRARSNIDRSEDADLADQAIELLREEGVEGYRITVKSEAISLPDFAEMQQDGTEFMTAMSGMVSAMVKLPPVAMPILPELATALKWYASRFRGAVEIESAMDRMAKKLQKLADAPPQQPGQDDSKVQAQQLKNQGDQQRIQLEAQNRSKELQEETQAELAKQKAQLEADLQLKSFELEHKAQTDREQHHMQLQADAQHHASELQAQDVQQQREMQAGDVEAQRQEQQERAAHERQLEAEQVKAKSATAQLRMKGQQQKEAAKVKAKAAAKKPGGKSGR